MIQIDELVLRIPGIREDEAMGLAKELAEKVSAGLPAGTGGAKIPELKIKTEASLANGSSGFTDEIAKQIIRQIKLASL